MASYSGYQDGQRGGSNFQHGGQRGGRGGGYQDGQGGGRGGGNFQHGGRGGGGNFQHGGRGGGGNFQHGGRGGNFQDGGRGGGGQRGGRGGGYQDGQGGRGGGAYNRSYSDVSVQAPLIEPGAEYYEGQFPQCKNEGIIINAYDLQTPKRPVYRYELKFFAAYPGRDGGPRRLLDLSTFEHLANDEIQRVGAGAFVSRKFATKEFLPNLRRQCITKLYQQLFDDHPQVFESDKYTPENDGYFHLYAYDRSSIFYCSLEIADRQTYLNPFRINLENVHADVRGALKQPEEIFATLKRTGYLNPEEGINEIELKTYLEILFSQKQFDGVDRFVKFNSKVFDLNSRPPLPENPASSCTLKDGQQKSVNVLADKFATLQIDASISPFHTPLTLPHYINARWGYHEGTDYANIDVFTHLNEELKGLFVRTTHLPVNDIFRIERITHQGAQAITFRRTVNGQEHEISVVDYFSLTYRIQLEYPNLPCIVKINRRVRNEAGETVESVAYYPMEVLLVQQGQKYRKEDMTQEQERTMIQESQRRPLTLMDEIANQKALACLTNADDIVRSARVGIGEEMKQISAEVLPAPVITYANNAGKRITFAEWDVNRTRFVAPARISSLLVLYEKKHEDMAYKLEADVLNRAGDYGMQLGQVEYCGMTDFSYETLKRTIIQYRESHGVEFVFAIASGSPIHHNLKASEAFTLVKTQQIEPKTLFNKGKPLGGATKGNILSKTNPKAGGYNQYFQQNAGGQELDVLRSFVSSTLVIGIQISHPSPGMEKKQPSVCGYSYNVHDTGNVARGGFFYFDMNPPNDENSANHVRPAAGPQSPGDDDAAKSKGRVLKGEYLRILLDEAMDNYRRAQNKYPQRVLIYRFGTSEGEVEKIQNDECGVIENILSGYGGKIDLSVILVLRQHNVRLFKNPAVIDPNERAPQQNVAPGTCVPGNKETEFVIVAHRALQGTAKPTFYSIIWPKENHLPLNLLKNVTHSLCYMHEIVPSAISVPAHVRNAEQMATRGKNLWKTKDNEMGHVMDQTQLYTEATTTLQATFPTRYWA